MINHSAHQTAIAPAWAS